MTPRPRDSIHQSIHFSPTGELLCKTATPNDPVTLLVAQRHLACSASDDLWGLTEGVEIASMLTAAISAALRSPVHFVHFEGTPDGGTPDGHPPGLTSALTGGADVSSIALILGLEQW